VAEITGAALRLGVYQLCGHLILVHGALDVAEDPQRGRSVRSVRQPAEREGDRRIVPGRVVDEDLRVGDRRSIDDLAPPVPEHDRLRIALTEDDRLAGAMSIRFWTRSSLPVSWMKALSLKTLQFW
jgi:hypothetical protein